MKTKSVSYKKGSVNYKVTVREADFLMGVTRAALVESQKNEVAKMTVEGNPFFEAAKMAIKLMTFPSLIAGTSKNIGFDHWPLTPEEIMGLPEGFVQEWENAVYDLNPHWQPEISLDIIGESESPEQKKDLKSDSK